MRSQQLFLIFNLILFFIFNINTFSEADQTDAKRTELAQFTENPGTGNFEKKIEYLPVNFYNSPTGNPFWTPEDTIFKTGLRYGILAGAPLLAIYYGITTWDWGDNKEFHFSNEKWFQDSTYSGGSDKIGHSFAHYSITRTAYSIFSYTEKSRNMAVALSGITGALVGTIIEIGDGFSEIYGFSKGDLAADFAGILLAMISDKYPKVDAFLGFTATYFPTKQFRKHNDKHFLDFTEDYSGWKYTLNFKPAGFRYFGFDIPEFLRFIQFDIGYYTRNYTKYDNEEGKFNGKRYIFYGISINMREATNSFFTSHERTRWTIEQPFKYYHIPGYEKSHQIGSTHDSRN